MTALHLNVKYTRHCERSEAIHDLRSAELPRYARSDRRVFMRWGGFVALKVSPVMRTHPCEAPCKS